MLLTMHPDSYQSLVIFTHIQNTAMDWSGHSVPGQYADIFAL